MTSNQALFTEYLISTKSSLSHAIALAHKLSGQEAAGFYHALAELQAGLRHIQAAYEKIEPALKAEFESEVYS